jgi:hypothetical protein
MSFVTENNGFSQAGDWFGAARHKKKAIAFSSMMASHQDVLRFIDAGGEVRRPAVVWMQLLHQIAMRPRYFTHRRAFLEAQNLIGLVLRHRARSSRLGLRARAAPRVSVILSCATPSGKAAVEISL